MRRVMISQSQIFVTHLDDEEIIRKIPNYIPAQVRKNSSRHCCFTVLYSNVRFEFHINVFKVYKVDQNPIYGRIMHLSVYIRIEIKRVIFFKVIEYLFKIFNIQYMALHLW